MFTKKDGLSNKEEVDYDYIDETKISDIIQITVLRLFEELNDEGVKFDMDIDLDFDMGTEPSNSQKPHETWHVLSLIYKDLTFKVQVLFRTIEKENIEDSEIICIVTILAENLKDILDIRIEEFKILIKDKFMSEFSGCYWVYDIQSLEYSKQGYALVNETENKFREFIVNSILINCPGDVREILPCKVLSTVLKRETSYKDNLPEYKNVNLDLFSTDSRDLLKIIQSISLRKGTTIYNLMDFFANSMVFENTWEEFCDVRNNLAHNKLINKSMYDKICSKVSYIHQELSHASEKIKDLFKSKEVREVIAFFKKAEIAEELTKSEYYNAEKMIRQKLLIYIESEILDKCDCILENEEIVNNGEDIDLEFKRNSSIIDLANHDNECFKLIIKDFIYFDNEYSDSFIEFIVQNKDDEVELSLAIRKDYTIIDEEIIKSGENSIIELLKQFINK